MIGVRDRKQKTLKLMPAAGLQVARLQARLHDVSYDDVQQDAADTEDISKRIALNTRLVQAFGSSRRVRQLGQKAVSKQVESNVLERDAIEHVISEMGIKAAEDGFTTAKETPAVQVLAKVSADRSLPPHNPEAITASEAYVFSSLVSKANWRHLDVGYLVKAMKDPEHLAELRAGTVHRKKVDAFVDYALELDPPQLPFDDSDAIVLEACRWLALYSTCRKVSHVRPGTVIVQQEEDQDAGADIGEDDEKDVFAQHSKMGKSMAAISWQRCFCSEAATEWALRKFGDIVQSETGNAVFRMSNKQEQVLRATTVVCAVRCWGHSLPADMGGALVKALAPMTLPEVVSLLKDVGCKVTSVKSKKFGTGLTATLLPPGAVHTTLASALPAIKRRAGPRKKINT